MIPGAVTLVFDWGDSTTPTDQPVASTTAEHTYAASGTYTITVTARSGTGATVSTGTAGFAAVVAPPEETEDGAPASRRKR